MRTRENTPRNRLCETCSLKSPRSKVDPPVKKQYVIKQEKPRAATEAELEAKIRLEMWKEYNEKLHQFESEYTNYEYEPNEEPEHVETSQSELFARISELKDQIAQAKKRHIKLTENDEDEHERELKLKKAIEQTKDYQRDEELKLKKLREEADSLIIEGSGLRLQLRTIREMRDMLQSTQLSESSIPSSASESSIIDENPSETSLKKRKICKKKAVKKRAKGHKKQSQQTSSSSDLSMYSTSQMSTEYSVRSLPFEKVNSSTHQLTSPDSLTQSAPQSIVSVEEPLESLKFAESAPQSIVSVEELASVESLEPSSSSTAVDSKEEEQLSSTELPKELFRAPYRIEIPRRPKRN